MKELPFGKWLFNSVVVTLIQTVSNVFFAALAGFTFARLEFPGRKLIFTLMFVIANDDIFLACQLVAVKLHSTGRPEVPNHNLSQAFI